MYSFFSDNIHVAASASGQRLGCYKIGIYMETFSVHYLVPVWGGTHPALCMEYGKHGTSQRTDHLEDLDIGEKII